MTRFVAILDGGEQGYNVIETTLREYVGWRHGDRGGGIVTADSDTLNQAGINLADGMSC